MYIKFYLNKGEYSRANCSFHAPLSSSVVYYVWNGVVYDKSGMEVDGVEAWDDGGDPSVCGIRIESMEAVHGEEDDPSSVSWTILLEFSEGGIHGQPDLDTIEVGIHLRDDHILKPELQDYLGFKPLHYDLSIIPDLLTNNQTISFTGNAKVSSYYFVSIKEF